MKYQIDVKIVGHKKIEIEAHSPAEAKIKALAKIENGLDTSDLEHETSIPQNAVDEDDIVYWF